MATRHENEQELLLKQQRVEAWESGQDHFALLELMDDMHDLQEVIS